MDNFFIGESVEDTRYWALELAVSSNKKGIGAKKILEDAETFLGFLKPEKAQLHSLPQPQKKRPAVISSIQKKVDDLAEKTSKKRCVTSKDDLTPRQEEVLSAIININAYNLSATRKEIGRRINMSPNNVWLYVKDLIKKGYVEDVKKTGQKFKSYIAVKSLSGKPLNPDEDKPVRDEETGILKCPPGYAEGYLESTIFEGL